MRTNIIWLFLLLTSLLVMGCGNSDSFVYTGIGNQPGPDSRIGVPAQLAFVQNPSQTTNTDFSTPPIVEVQDAFGDRVPGATNTITVALVNPGTATLNGQKVRDAVDGQAVFTGLSVDQPGTFTLTCSSPGLEGDQSATFTVTPSLALYSLASVQGDGDPTQLIQLNPETGEYLGTVGFLESAGTSLFFDLECLPNGSVYAVGRDGSQNTDLILVNMSDPSASTKAFDVTGVDRLFSLAYDSNNGIMYATCEKTNGGNDFALCTLDLQTGVATPAANLLTQTGAGYGLAFDESTDTLYLTSDKNLASVDPATGIDTLIGAGGTVDLAESQGDDGIKGLDFNPLTNELFAVSRGGAFLNTEVGSRAGRINTSNGTSVQTGYSPECSGLSFWENPTVPGVGPARQTGYTVSAITQAFEEISGTGNPLGLSDDDSSNESIGFTFNFNGTDYTTVHVMSNGYISFAGSSTEYEPELLPTDTFPDETLFVWGDDLDPADPAINGDIYVETLGTAPNRRFVVQYNVNHYADFAGIINCEIILYEGTNVIEFHYDDVTFGSTEHDAGQGAVVGIQTDSTHADIWSIFQPVLTDNTAIRFTPPSP